MKKGILNILQKEFIFLKINFLVPKNSIIKKKKNSDFLR